MPAVSPCARSLSDHQSVRACSSVQSAVRGRTTDDRPGRPGLRCDQQTAAAAGGRVTRVIPSSRGSTPYMSM